MNSYQQSQSPWTPKRIATITGSVIIAILFLFFMPSIWGWNSVGRMKTVQYLNGGQGFTNKQGIYIKAFGTVNDWPMVSNLSIGSYEGDKDDSKAADVERIPISFRGSATAHQSLLVRIDLPTTKAEMFEILRMFPGGYNNLVRKGLMPEIEMATRTAANLMDPEEALNNISSFKDKIQDQMIFGLYKTETMIEFDTAATGEIERRNAIKIVKNSETGQAMRIPLDLEKLGCKVRSVQASQPKFDDAVQTAINDRRQASLAAETAKKKRIAAEQEKLSAVAEGEKDVIQEQFKIQKQQATIVATARMNMEASALGLQAAKNRADSTIMLAEAESQAKRKIMAADGYMEKILQAEIRKTELIADAIKSSNVRWTPDVVIGDDAAGKSSSAVDNLIKMLSVGQANSISDAVKRAK